MAALLERDGFDAYEAADCAPAASEAPPARHCAVLECASTDSAMALLYVFYRIESALDRRAERPGLRSPGRLWRHAIDLRAGDRLRLADGRVAVVDKLVAAPCLAAIGELQVHRLRTYRLADDAWTAMQGA